MSIPTIVAVVLTAILGGPLVAGYLCLRAAWRWSDLDSIARWRVLRQMLLYGLMLGVPVGLVALLAGGVFDHPAAAVVGGVLVAGGLGVWLNRATADIDAIHRYGRQLDDPGAEQSALEKIREIAAAASPTDPIGRSVLVGAAIALGNAGYDREALPLLESVNPKDLSAHERELHALGLLDALIIVGELERARKALADVPLLEEGSIHANVLPMIEARLLLYEGKPREALALVAESVPDRIMERGRHVLRAHAYAALGDLERCHASLRWLHDTFGPKGLRRVIEPEGPGSPHARAWSGERQGPYRG